MSHAVSGLAQSLLIKKSEAFGPAMLIPVSVTAGPGTADNEVLSSVLDPKGCEGKFSSVVPSCTIGVAVLPKPTTERLCGLPEALSDTCKRASRVPVAVGVNSTETWQFEFAARLAGACGHSFSVIAKSLAFVPASATLEKTTGSVPVLTIVAPSVTGTPTGCALKVSVEAPNPIPRAAASPVAARGTASGLPTPAKATFTWAVLLPTAVGVKLKSIEQKLLTTPEQLLSMMPKSAASFPDIVTPEIVIGGVVA
jgi:hypothetical protein